jgi:hypothetical protein
MDAAAYPKFEQGIRRLAGRLQLPAAELKMITASLATLKNPRAVDEAPGAGVRMITAEEAAAARRAARLRYQDAPCQCGACQAAGVTERPRRFVPTLTRDGDEERVRDPQTLRLVVAGHWAHGAELARWYAAREACLRHAPAGSIWTTITRRMAKAALPPAATKEASA